MNQLASRPVVILILIAAIVRGGVLWMAFSQLHDDPDAYDAIARTLATTGTFAVVADGDKTVPTAFRPPLYPAILAMIHRSIIATRGDLQDPLVSGKTPVSRTAIAIFHWVLSLATVVITYFAALRMLRLTSIADRQTTPVGDTTYKMPSFFAALMVAVDPILIQSSVRVMTETLATMLAITALYCWCRLVDKMTQQSDKNESILATALPLGLVLAFAYLCRPTFIVWTVLLIGYLFLWSMLRMLTSWHERSHRREDGSAADHRSTFAPAIAAVAISLIAALFVGGWTMRNQHHFGKPIWATTHGGYTLLLGNNPSFFQYMRSGKVGIAWDPQPFFDRWEMRGHSDPRKIQFWESEEPLQADPAWQTKLKESKINSELFEDRLAYETARMAIANDFDGFIQATFWRTGRLLSPMPQVFEDASKGKRVSAMIVTVYYSVIIGLMVMGIYRLSRVLLQPRWMATITLVISLVAVHAIYWSNMRMRAPAIPALAILAAVPLCKKNLKQSLS